MLFGTAVISSSTVVVAGTFFGAGSYALSVLATSALGLPQLSALTTPTSVVVAAYALPTAVATTVGACVVGVPVTGTATLSGPNSTVAAQYVSVSLGSAVAYGISCTGSTVTFTVVPSAVGTNALSVTVSAPFACSVCSSVSPQVSCSVSAPFAPPFCSPVAGACSGHARRGHARHRPSHVRRPQAI